MGNKRTRLVILLIYEIFELKFKIFKYQKCTKLSRFLSENYWEVISEVHVSKIDWNNIQALMINIY